MPIYGYHCDTCGNEFEILQSMKDDPLKICPKCTGALRKMLYPVGISFKGSGFYTTDYKGTAKTSVESQSGSGEGAGGDSKSGGGESKSTATESKQSGGDSKSESKSESKNDSKSESKPSGGETKSESKKPAATSGE